jgi:sedoheptulokinase
MTFLGIDLGTTFVKGAVLDLDQLRLDHIQRLPFPAPLSGLPANHYEVSPEAVVAAVQQAIQALLPYAAECQGIVLSTQMHSVLLVSQAGELLSQAVTWLDQRGLEPHPSGETYFKVLSDRLGPQLREELGNELRLGLPIGTLFWQREQHDTDWLRKAIPLTMADFVLTRLAGAAPGIDLTNAAATGALDVRHCSWHQEALTRLGLDRLAWPAIEPLTKPAGVYHIDGQAIPCYRAVGDAQCSLIGAGITDGELSINIATGSQVSLLREQPARGSIQTRPFFDQRFLTTFVGLPAGRALNLLVALLTELASAAQMPMSNPWDYLLKAAAAAPDSDLRINLAFFAGEERAHGAIEQISESNLSAGGLFRAAFRQMAENYYEAACRLSPTRNWQRLVLTGGLARQSELLRDFIAQRFGCDYRLGPAEDALTGLLTLALVCAGRATSVAEAATRVQQALH